MRRYRSRRKRKNKTIIISMCLVLLLMTAGYAAMQTNLNINAKGNVLQSSIDITDNIVDSGDGLYVDCYEAGRYVYKGASPNNYVIFNDELWRIISKEADGTYKIIRDEVLSNNMAWDNASGCEVVYNKGLKENEKNIVSNIIYLAPGGGGAGCNNWARPASLNTYLNNDYYNNLTSTAKKQIISHTWNIGTINDDNNDLATQIENEKSTIWTGDIGLITVSDYIIANTNVSNCGSLGLNNGNVATCRSTNWMYLNDDWWTIASILPNPQVIYISDSAIYNVESVWSSSSMPIFPRPAVYLSSDVKIIDGDGTKNNPYILSVQ